MEIIVNFAQGMVESFHKSENYYCKLTDKMLFNSIPFLLFFPLVCIFYFAIPSTCIKKRNIFLLIVSYYFYMNWEPVYALLLFTSTLITYLSAIGISYFAEKRRRKACLVCSLILNLAILFLFKYFIFFADNVDCLFHYLGIDIDMPSFSLLLPVGISFYTFQALGYSIDVYKGTTKVERDFMTYALFVSFFPQLVAGPIERSNNLLPQFKEQHKFDYDRVMAGLRMMLWGYFLKLALADRCSIYIDVIFNHVGVHNGGSYLIASLLFPFQIYGDFGGYSLIAIGVARVLGFRLMENFRRPYFSISVSDFWHRWHISLSTWFKDYVYISLGGNRVGRLRCYFNLLVTFVVSGIWHGANWTFILWGTLHGFFLCLERFLGIGRKTYSGLRKVVHIIITFVVVSFAWIFFRADCLSDALTVISDIIFKMGIPNEKQYGVWFACILALALLFVKELSLECNWRWTKRVSQSPVLSHIYMIVMIVYIILFGVFRGDQFIYFQF